ncbi:MAG: hypothetical protein ACR2QE_14960 [Acidimicrobiales bacterium]
MTEQTHTDRRATAGDARLHPSTLPAESSTTAVFDPRSTLAIARLDDTTMRNLWITQRYHELAARFTPFLGRDHGWCTFAVWRSAGLGRGLRRTETAHPSLSGEVNALLEALAAQEAAAFGQLAPLFDGFIRQFESGTAQSPDRQRVLAEIGVLDADAPVRVAFGQYFAAVHDTDEVRRSQRVLAANLLVALHCEDQLQVELEGVLEAVSALAERSAIASVPPVVPTWLARRLRRSDRDQVVATSTARIDAALGELTSTVIVDGDTLDLEDPEARPRPSALAVASTSVLAEVLDIWSHGDGEAGWLDRNTRMRATETFFRSGQHDDRLAVTPFGRRQLEAMRRLQAPTID